MNKKNVIIDIDNTLVNYVKNLYDIAKKENSDIPHFSVWEWETIYDIFGQHKGAELVNQAVDITNKHTRALPTASEFTHLLKAFGIEVKIVTNREDVFYNQTKHWLDKNKIYYDDLIFTKSHKDIFVNESTLFVFDDSPNVIKACLSLSSVYSIMWNWNKNLPSVKVEKPIDIAKILYMI